MRYAEYSRARRRWRAGPATHPELREPRPVVELIREAARTDRYWVLAPEAQDVWALRHLDGATGELGPAEHSTGPIDSDGAMTWARGLVDVAGWRGMTRPYPGAYIDELYGVVREVARTPRPGRVFVARIENDSRIADLRLLTVQERWIATGLDTDPFHLADYSDFADEADMLRKLSQQFGLDADRWAVLAPGAGYIYT